MIGPQHLLAVGKCVLTVSLLWYSFTQMGFMDADWLAFRHDPSSDVPLWDLIHFPMIISVTAITIGPHFTVF